MSGPVTLLDGATGTELSRRGLDTRLPLWSARALADRPDVVETVHREYVGSGCLVLTACTFRTHERTLARGGLGGRGDELNASAVRAARRGAAAAGVPGVRVAGSMAPLEDCFRPDLVPPLEELAAEHGRQALSLARAGVDLLLVETMNTVREAIAAVRAAVATGLPAWCSFVTDGSGRLPSGERLETAVSEVERLGTASVLVNCVPMTDLAGEVARLAASTSLPVGGYGNIGHAHDVDGWRVELMLEPEAFADHALACRAAGATLLGGCCGTEPRHLAELARRLREAG